MQPPIPDDAQLRDAARRVGDLCIARVLTLATAESCTGGWIAKVVTDLAGSSAWFDGGLVAYSYDAKQGFLGVPADTLEAHGAVSRETAVAMAAGALARSAAGIAVAVTGIAGPSGATADKPVGTVWIAWQQRDGIPVSRIFHFDGDREAVRRRTVAAALAGLAELVG